MQAQVKGQNEREGLSRWVWRDLDLKQSEEERERDGKGEGEKKSAVSDSLSM